MIHYKHRVAPAFLIGIILLSLPYLTGCSKGAFSEHDSASRGLSLPKENFVGIPEIELFAKLVFPATKTGELGEYTIEPIIGSNGDTLAYVLNTNGNGWIV